MKKNTYYLTMVLLITLLPVLLGCQNESQPKGADVVNNAPKKGKIVSGPNIQSPNTKNTGKKKAAAAPKAVAEKVEADLGVNTVAGKGTTDDSQKPVVVNFQISKTNKITGSLNIDGTPHKVAGILDKQTLRCWIEGIGETKETTWRGTLLGTLADKNLTGSFSVSNNGAEQTITGKWQGQL